MFYLQAKGKNHASSTAKIYMNTLQCKVGTPHILALQEIQPRPFKTITNKKKPSQQCSYKIKAHHWDKGGNTTEKQTR